MLFSSSYLDHQHWLASRLCRYILKLLSNLILLLGISSWKTCSAQPKIFFLLSFSRKFAKLWKLIYSRHDILELNPQNRDEIDSTSRTIVPARDDLSRRVDCNDDVARMCDDGDPRPAASGCMDPMKHLSSLVHDDSTQFHFYAFHFAFARTRVKLN